MKFSSSTPIPAIAFFDLDHTLLNCNSSFKFGQYLYGKKTFSFLTMCQLAGYYFLHKVNLVSIRNLHHKIFKKLFRGKPLSFFQQQADQFINEQFDTLLYLPAIERLHFLQAHQTQIVILSSSPQFLVGPFADRLAIKEWKSTTYDIDKDGLLCKISDLMEGEEKAKYCFSMSTRLGVSKDNLEAYSDSYLDLPFLLAVGRAIAVNPDRKLHHLSQEYEWEIL